MAVKIRLRRVGAKKQPAYRLVAADASAPRDGRFLETLGFYNPRTDPATLKVDEGRVIHWLARGARPTETAQRLLERSGVWQRWLESRGDAVAGASGRGQASAESEGG